jgi:hypothetical protein
MNLQNIVDIQRSLTSATLAKVNECVSKLEFEVGSVFDYRLSFKVHCSNSADALVAPIEDPFNIRTVNTYNLRTVSEKANSARENKSKKKTDSKPK